jgi:hypothetical protein
MTSSPKRQVTGAPEFYHAARQAIADIKIQNSMFLLF